MKGTYKIHLPIMNSHLLYLVTDRTGLSSEVYMRIVEQSVQGGVQWVQLREKSADIAEMLAIAQALKSLLKPYAVPLIINDRLDIALAVQAEGLHLGQSDGNVLEARSQLGPKAILGLSVETMEQAATAQTLPVDYIAASPVFSTATKLDTAQPWGLDGLIKLCEFSQKPVIAIGGIHLDNALSVIQAGAYGIAVVSAIMQASNPLLVAQNLKKAIR